MIYPPGWIFKNQSEKRGVGYIWQRASPCFPIRTMAPLAQCAEVISQTALKTFEMLRDLRPQGGGQFPTERNPYISKKAQSYYERQRRAKSSLTEEAGSPRRGTPPIPTARDYLESNDAGVKNMPLVMYRRNNIDTI